MQHKGLVAKTFYASEAGVFVGEIINTPDVIAFSAATLGSLQEAMIEAVESYLNGRNVQSLDAFSTESAPLSFSPLNTTTNQQPAQAATIS